MQVGVKSLEEHAILQTQGFLERFMLPFAKKNPNCRELGIFLGAKFGLKILLRVKELTFRNSVYSCATLLDLSQRPPEYGIIPLIG